VTRACSIRHRAVYEAGQLLREPFYACRWCRWKPLARDGFANTSLGERIALLPTVIDVARAGLRARLSASFTAISIRKTLSWASSANAGSIAGPGPRVSIVPQSRTQSDLLAMPRSRRSGTVSGTSRVHGSGAGALRPIDERGTSTRWVRCGVTRSPASSHLALAPPRLNPRALSGTPTPIDQLAPECHRSAAIVKKGYVQRRAMRYRNACDLPPACAGFRRASWSARLATRPGSG